MSNDFNKRYLEFCKPFIDAFREVYSTMLETELDTKAPYTKKEATSHGIYSAIMGINGVYEGTKEKKEFRGSLVITWTKEAYLNSAGKMLMEEYTEIDEEIKDVGMEICNITMGNAKKVLAPNGFKIKMSIPTSVTGEGHILKCENGVMTVVTPIESPLGQIVIELNYDDFEIQE